MVRRLMALSIVLTALPLACGGDDDTPAETRQRSPTFGAAPAQTPAATDGTVGLSLTSEAFAADEAIPSRFTCDGDDISPPLAWEGVPDEARSFVMIVTDPDAPGGEFVHWLIYNIRSSVRELPESVEKSESPAAAGGGLQGRNDLGDLGYGGPCPPEGESHRYDFRLYALDSLIDVGPDPSRDDVLAAIEGRMLALTTLTGTYERPQ